MNLTRRAFVGGTGAIAVSAPWWFSYVRKFFGPTGSIHDMGGIREATPAEVERVTSGLEDMLDGMFKAEDIHVQLADFEGTPVGKSMPLKNQAIEGGAVFADPVTFPSVVGEVVEHLVYVTPSGKLLAMQDVPYCISPTGDDIVVDWGKARKVFGLS